MPSLKRIDPSRDYHEAASKLAARGEANFCSPVALAIVTGISPEAANEMMLAEGRKPKRGTPQYIFNKLLDRLGYERRRVKLADVIASYPKPHCDVLKNITTHHPRRFPGSFDPSKTYVAHVNGHILAIVDGEVKDWSVNRSLRIYLLEEVIKKEN